MESLDKDHAYSDSSLPSSAAQEENAVPDITLYHLRDRELLRKRKAEAQEKDAIHWIQREKIKRQRRSRGGRRGRGRQSVVKLRSELELEPDPQPGPQGEAEPVPSELSPLQMVHQEQPPVLTTLGLAGGMQSLAGGMQEELAALGQDPATDEVEVLNLAAAAEIPEDLNTPLENDHLDN